MPKAPVLPILAALLPLILCSGAFAEGEDILALTGQYTFFIKPEPGSCETYYQKMVPCLLKADITVPRRVVPVYPVPFSAPRGVPVLRSEVPVGCADGSGPCLQCFPMPSCRPATHEMVVPVPRPIPVPDLIMEPKCVTTRIMKPQWFKVKDVPLPPRKVARKVK